MTFIEAMCLNIIVHVRFANLW